MIKGSDPEEEARKAKIAAIVRAELEEKMLKDAEAEKDKWRLQMAQQEQEQRRENVKKGNRMHPQLRKLDTFVMKLQQEEDAEHTRYLDWRDDVMEGVSCPR